MYGVPEIGCNVGGAISSLIKSWSRYSGNVEASICGFDPSGGRSWDLAGMINQCFEIQPRFGCMKHVPGLQKIRLCFVDAETCFTCSFPDIEYISSI